MEVREWSTRFFTDDAAIPVVKKVAVWRGKWPDKGLVIWASGQTSNALNPRLKLTVLSQPEEHAAEFDDQDKDLLWTLFAPSAIVQKDVAEPPAKLIPTTLLLGAQKEEIGYGLRYFFETAGTGVLLCLSGREGGLGGDPGGRWNVGITQAMIEEIFRNAGLRGKPEVRVLAGYSTGYGVVQTINNDLVPLKPVTRLILFDCIYRTDAPKLPANESPPTLQPGDMPEYPPYYLDELNGRFLGNPFNSRRAIDKLTAAAPSARVIAYSATSGGSPRYVERHIVGRDAKGNTKFKGLVHMGSHPAVDIPLLAELRSRNPLVDTDLTPSLAFDTLVLSRYLQLGAAARLVSSDELKKRVPFIQATISSGLPQRGAVFASPVTQSAATPLPGTKPKELFAWAKSLPDKLSPKERNIAAHIVVDHMLVLPGWAYLIKDKDGQEEGLDNFRHGAVLSEFGWEFLPP